MPTRAAYMPLPTYPGSIEDGAILAAARFAVTLGFELHVRAFSVDIPQVHSPLLGMLVDVPGLIRSAEEQSRVECQRLKGLLEGPIELRGRVHYFTREVVLGAAFDAAAAEARYHDLSVLPWSGETALAQDMSEAVVFGSGRPTLLVPPSARPASLDHVAIAWDESRVAARALGDALSLLPAGGRVSVLTVKDEKPLSGSDIARLLASSLERRGFEARPCSIGLGGKTIADALQDAAMTEGAQILAMGGFGHSRLRDFVLGGATKGVLTNLRLPALLSH
ncbi:MAG: universal stress protein [Reyranella sp.]|nr:universal stress protein [Reyranella sp.]